MVVFMDHSLVYLQNNWIKTQIPWLEPSTHTENTLLCAEATSVNIYALIDFMPLMRHSEESCTYLIVTHVSNHQENTLKIE